MKETGLKILGLLIFAALCLWVCLKCSGQPLPPGAKPILRSPKDAANQPVKLVAPALAVAPAPITNLLYWDCPASNTIVIFSAWNTSNQTRISVTNVFHPAFSVEYKPQIFGPWSVLGLVTNQYNYKRVTTSPSEFYRVGGFWP